MGLKIKYVEWGLANNFGDHIEINKNLKKYPKLHKYAVTHERSHKEKFDLFHEFTLNFPIVFKLIYFCIIYPKALIDLSPIQIRKNKIIYDINLILLYSIIIFLVIIIKLAF